jgi:N-acetylneuraminate synthase
MSIFVIAEAGVNHNGDIARALDLVHAAADADADAVKFQTFKAERLVSNGAPKADYANKTTDIEESQFEMIRKLELDDDAHRAIIECCEARSIEFMSTPFDAESARHLASAFKVKRLKIPSGEMVNPLLLLAAARTGKPVLLSTGMSDLGEIEASLGVLAYGYLGGDNPGEEEFSSAYHSDEGRAALLSNVTLLHCTTEYPAPLESINLRAIHTMSATFGLGVGYSDHSKGIRIPIAAAALGATVIEKHFTLDRTLPGPDHAASLEPDQLAEMVHAIRDIELAMGSAEKKLTATEARNLPVVRGSLVAARDIENGAIMCMDDLTVKRPGNGISPMEYWNYVGHKAQRDYKRDDLI